MPKFEPASQSIDGSWAWIAMLLDGPVEVYRDGMQITAIQIQPEDEPTVIDVQEWARQEHPSKILVLIEKAWRDERGAVQGEIAWQSEGYRAFREQHPRP